MRTYELSGTSAPAPREPAQDTGRHKPKAAANHLSVNERVKLDAARVDEDAAALDRTLAAGKRLDPPGRKPVRNWQLAFHKYAQNCNECGRIIEPKAEHYADRISRHLVRHVACHEKAEGKR